MLKDDIDCAITAGIPVITVDSNTPTSKRLFFIGTDNYQAGRIGGQRLAKELNSKGNVTIFGIPEMANMKERLRGYRDSLEAFSGIKIRRIVDIKGDPRIAFDVTAEILGKDKKEPTNAFACLEGLAGKRDRAQQQPHQRQGSHCHGHRRRHPGVDQERRDHGQHPSETVHHDLCRLNELEHGVTKQERVRAIV
jgi:hypothetical protein